MGLVHGKAGFKSSSIFFVSVKYFNIFNEVLTSIFFVSVGLFSGNFGEKKTEVGRLIVFQLIQ